MQRTSRFNFFALLTLLSVLFAPVSRAQTAVDGAVGGTVVDSSGAIVSGATVTVLENATNAEQTATADSAGYFRVIHLQPGTYSVTINAPGFEPYKSVDVTVQVGLLTTIDAHMQVGSTSQTVEVTGASPLVNTTNPDFAGIIDQKVLHDLPVSNYRWSSYALLTPAVVNDSNGYGLLSFRGQSTLLNNVTIDGTDDNQAFFSEERGRTRAGYSTAKESVQEFQVNTSNYSVEYGRSAGGIVNSVTKSGTNAFHGVGYYFDRDSAWAATNSTVFAVNMAWLSEARSGRIRSSFSSPRTASITTFRLLPPSPARAQMQISIPPLTPRFRLARSAAAQARLLPLTRTPMSARSQPIPACPTEGPTTSTTRALPGFKQPSVPCREPATRPSTSPKSTGR